MADAGVLVLSTPGQVTFQRAPGGKVVLLGETLVDVKFRGVSKKLNVLIARGEGPSLLGRDWLPESEIELHGILNVKVDSILDKYWNVS